MTFPTDFAPLMSFTRPKHSMSTTAAPPEPRHLSILLLDHSKSKLQHLGGYVEPTKASPRQAAQLLELPESPARICSLRLGRRDGDLQQTESSDNRMLPEIGPSGDHTNCSLCGHRHLGVRILLPVCTSGAVGRRNLVAREPKATNCFFGCWGYKDPRDSPSWGRGTKPGAGSGTQGAKQCFPACSCAPAIKLQYSKLGRGGPASEELHNSSPGASQKKSKAAQALRNPLGLRVGPCKTSMEQQLVGSTSSS